MGDWQPGEDVELGVRAPTSSATVACELNTGGFDPVARLTFQEQAALALQRASDAGRRQRADSRRLLRLSPACGGRAGVRPERCDRALRRPRPLPRRASPTIPVTEPASRCAASSSSWASLAEAAAGAFQVNEPWRAGADLLELVRRYRELERPSRHVRAAGPLPAGARALPEPQAGRCRGGGGRLPRAPRRDRDRPRSPDAGRVGAAHVPTLELRPRDTDRGRVLPERASRGRRGATRSTVRATGSPPNSRSPSRPTPSSRLRTGCALRTATTPTHGPRSPMPGEPFDPPLIEVTCTLRIGSHTLELTRPAVHSEFFAGGYRELEPSVLPPISVETSTNRHVLRAQDVPQTAGAQCRGPRSREEAPDRRRGRGRGSRRLDGGACSRRGVAQQGRRRGQHPRPRDGRSRLAARDARDSLRHPLLRPPLRSVDRRPSCRPHRAWAASRTRARASAGNSS